MPVIGTVCPGTQDYTCFVLPNRFSPTAGCVLPSACMTVITMALLCRNAPALCVRVHLKLYVLVHPNRDAERRQPMIGTMYPGGKNLLASPLMIKHKSSLPDDKL